MSTRRHRRSRRTATTSSSRHGTPPNPPGPSLVRYATGTGDLEQFPIDGALPGYRITEQVASADGSVVALQLRSPAGADRTTDVAIWTPDGGFELIDPSRFDVVGNALDGLAISPGGRYVSALVHLDDGSTELTTYDRMTRWWGNRWVSTPGQMVNVLATLDDGAVIFDATTFTTGVAPESDGVRRWPRSGGTAQQLVPGDSHARGFAASANGRFIAYAASDPDAPASPSWVGRPFLLDRSTGRTWPAGTPGDEYRGATYPIAITGDGSAVALFTTEFELLSVGGPIEWPPNNVVIWSPA